MFDIGIGFSEIFLLAVIVIIVVGPEELPGLLRTVGRYIGQVKRIADDFRAQFDEAIQEPMDEIRGMMDDVGEGFEDDPFGEEDLIDFEEHNQKILDKEKADKEQKNREQKDKKQAEQNAGEAAQGAPLTEHETATEKVLRESGVAGLAPVDPAKNVDPAENRVKTTKTDPTLKFVEGDVLPVKKSGT